MASEKTLARLDVLIWVLIYVGLFGVVIGWVAREASSGWSAAICALGGILVVLGVLLIVLRSRMSSADR